MRFPEGTFVPTEFLEPDRDAELAALRAEHTKLREAAREALESMREMRSYLANDTWQGSKYGADWDEVIERLTALVEGE